MDRNRSFKKRSLLQLFLVLALVVLVNLVASYSFYRIDLTSEGRYTITDATVQLLDQLDDVVYVEIYLAGDMPAEYRRLQVAIEDMLQEYSAYADAPVEWRFTNVFEEAETPKQAEEFVKTLTEKGIQPRSIAQQQADEVSQKVLLPSAMVFYKNKEVAVNFMPAQKELRENTANVINKSISTLEYKLSNALVQLLTVEQKLVSFIQGHGELSPLQMGDFAVALQQNGYKVDFVDLPKAVGIQPTTDAVVIAKPRSTFSEADKFKIDQYIMQGGNVLWLVESLKADLDSLLGGSPSFVAIDYNLNLEDQLFQYGVRINKDLLLDREANPIPVFSEGGKNRNFYPWPFYPVLFPEGNHPVVKHLDPVMLRFASTMDTIDVPGVKKTILLTSSPQATAWKVPVMVRLEVAVNPPLPEQFNASDLPVGVLLEGRFKSLYTNRIPKDFLQVYRDSLGMTFRSESTGSPKQIIISDGDVIRNPVSQDGRIAPLGTYRFNRSFLFANRDLLLNAIDYMTDQYGIVAARNKDFKIRPLQPSALQKNRWRWQVANIALPVMVLLLFAGVYNFIRKKKYEGKV